MLQIYLIEKSMDINCVQRHFINVNDSKNHQIIGPVYAHLLGPVVVTLSKIYEFARDIIKACGEIILTHLVGVGVRLINAGNRITKRKNSLNNPLSIKAGCCLAGKAFVDLLKIPQIFLIHLAKPGLLVVEEKLAEEIKKVDQDRQLPANIKIRCVNFSKELNVDRAGEGFRFEENLKNENENEKNKSEKKDLSFSLDIETLSNRLRAAELQEKIVKNLNEQLNIEKEQLGRQIQELNAKIKEFEEKQNGQASQVEPLGAFSEAQNKPIIHPPPLAPPPPPEPRRCSEEKKTKWNSNKHAQSADLSSEIKLKPELKNNVAPIAPCKTEVVDPLRDLFREAIDKFRKDLIGASKNKLDALETLQSAISNLEDESNDESEDLINIDDVLKLVEGEDESLFQSTLDDSVPNPKIAAQSAKKKVSLSQLRLALNERIEKLKEGEQISNQTPKEFTSPTNQDVGAVYE